MERNRESMEQIFEDNGGEQAVIAADDTGMLAEQRITLETELDEDLDAESVEGAGDDVP